MCSTNARKRAGLWQSDSFHDKAFWNTFAAVFRCTPNLLTGVVSQGELNFECDHTCSASAELRSVHIGSRIIYLEVGASESTGPKSNLASRKFRAGSTERSYAETALPVEPSATLAHDPAFADELPVTTDLSMSIPAIRSTCCRYWQPFHPTDPENLSHQSDCREAS